MRHFVRFALLALIMVSATACASAPRNPVDNSEIFDHDYNFDGDIAGRTISGSISFRYLGPEAVRYTLLSDVGLCSGEVRPSTTAWINLSCGGISMQFARRGRVIERANASLRTTRQESRRECGRWVTTDSGQRTCAMWVDRIVDVPVVVRGVFTVQRVAIEL